MHHHIRILTLDEMKTIHRRHMRRDFPVNELRPFHSVRQLYRQGRYLGIGLFDEQEALLAYAYFASLTLEGEKHYLFDYLAVVPDHRDSGVGSEFLKLLPSALSDGASIIGEVENPDLETEEAERRTKERRMQFYLRSGVRDTGVLTRLFGVDYRIMEYPLSRLHSPTEIASIYEAIYRSFLPDPVYQKQVRVEIPNENTEDAK